MSPRAYRLGKRAETAAETRRRIVEAAHALHGEQGIAATTMKQVARRAGVSIGTVYHHFATYEHLVRAWGRQSINAARMPTPAIFTGIDPVARRVERLAGEVFAYYERFPGLERARCDRDRIPAVEEALAREERALEELVREALKPMGGDEGLVRVTTVLVDFAVFRALTARGLSGQEAAARISDVVVAWLQRARPGPTPMPGRLESSSRR